MRLLLALLASRSLLLLASFSFYYDFLLYLCVFRLVELKGMADRIISMRSSLHDGLTKLGTVLSRFVL